MRLSLVPTQASVQMALLRTPAHGKDIYMCIVTQDLKHILNLILIHYLTIAITKKQIHLLDLPQIMITTTTMWHLMFNQQL